MPAKKTATKKAFQKPKLDPRRLHFKLGLLDLDSPTKSKKKTHGNQQTRGS